MKAEAQQWFEQAEQDLQTARILEQTARYGPCAFYCQQVAEKALKSTLYEAGQRPWGHSIPALLDQICAVFGVDERVHCKKGNFTAEAQRARCFAEKFRREIRFYQSSSEFISVYQWLK